MSRNELEKIVLDKMSTDMIFCFEMDESEKEQAIAGIATATDAELLKYIEN